jgi:hypothetical protein
MAEAKSVCNNNLLLQSQASIQKALLVVAVRVTRKFVKQWKEKVENTHR